MYAGIFSRCGQRMAEFGEDFDLDAFQAAYDSENPTELNRVKAVSEGSISSTTTSPSSLPSDWSLPRFAPAGRRPTLA